MIPRTTGRGRAVAVALVAAVAAGCGGDEMFGPPAEGSIAYDLRLPPGFPVPKIPAENPLTEAKVELGRHLFYDTRMSVNGEASCASCHAQARAFTDGRARAVGATGEVHPRGAMGLANMAYMTVLNWANPNVRRLEQQALIPMFGEDPVELGLSGLEDTLFARLKRDTTYQRLFPAAFPDRPQPVSLQSITDALASFQRAMVSADAPYDRFKYRGDRRALSESARRGEALFFSERLECFHCHGGPMFTASADWVGKSFVEAEFFNNGLYNVGGTGAYPSPNIGIAEFTGRPEDMGSFKPPSLRNIAVTAPYMHDGSIATLSEVIDHYAAGGRNVTSGPHAGDGRANPFKSSFVPGFTLTPQEKQDLLAFLESLTDSTFLTDPRFSDPWVAKGGVPRP
jgi:cytochrome c peroxidase